MKTTEYPKKIISFDEQIAKLKKRGMIIEDDDVAKKYLRNISYFRLQGYWWEYQIDKKNHKFIEGITFDDIIKLYTFDRKLRLLLFDAIERIEVALRTKMVYYLSIELGQWWFQEKEHFFDKDHFKSTLEDIDKELVRTKEVFIESHYENYGKDNRPPSYKTLEILSFGCLSRLYGNLKNDITAKGRIATEFDLPNSNFLKSWLLAFNIIRNISAHHSRLWNRKNQFPPKLLGKPNSQFINLPKDETLLYYSISCIMYTLNKVSHGHSLKNRFLNLMNASDFIDQKEMGFTENWLKEGFWNRKGNKSITLEKGKMAKAVEHGLKIRGSLDDVLKVSVPKKKK